MDKREQRIERSDQGLCIDCGEKPKVDLEARFGRCQECRDQNTRNQKSLYHRDIDKYRQRMRERNRIRRDRVFDHYGRRCVCCGETIEVFLCIDHIEGGGNAHRRRIGISTGGAFYEWLIANGFPEGFQTLCYNCNNGKRLLGHCPHEDGIMVVSNER